MKKYFCVSDIHGCYDALINAMYKCGYDERNPEHQLICCGDYFGRASMEPGDNVLVYEWLTADFHVNKPICIKGNHELIIEKMFKRNNVTYNDMYNGEHLTIAGFAGFEPDASQSWRDALDAARKTPLEQWVKNLPWYYETETHIFVHGSIPLHGISGPKHVGQYEWEQAAWGETDAWIAQMMYKYDALPREGKTIVFGHWHTRSLRESIDFQYPCNNWSTWFHKDLKLVGLDGCTALGNPLNVYIFEE